MAPLISIKKLHLQWHGYYRISPSNSSAETVLQSQSVLYFSCSYGVPFTATENVIVAVCSNVFETEQYFSNDNWAARYNRFAGTSPVAITLACISVNKEGTCPLTRSPSTWI